MSKKPDEKCLKKTNILIYQTPVGEKTERKGPCHGGKQYKPPICQAQPSRIRVCTGQELKKMNPPRICECPIPKNKFGILQLLGLGIKAVLAASVVYVTYDMGLWGTTDETQELYRMLCVGKLQPKQTDKADKWTPPACEAEKDLFHLPRFNPYSRCDEPPIDMSRKNFEWQNCWNKGVQNIFSTLVGLPDNLIQWVQEMRKKEPDKCIPYNKLPEGSRPIMNYKR